MVKLDAKDRKILMELDLNARRSYAQIGKKVGLAKSVVSYRVNRLISEKVIKRFLPVVNRVKLGHKSCLFFFKFQLITKELEKGFIEFARPMSNVKSISRCDGIFDFMLKVSFKTLDNVNNTYSSIIYKFGDNIADQQIDFIVNSYYLRNNFLYDKPVIDINKREENPLIPERIDKMDSEILELLRQDARMPTVEIARTLKVTTQTVINRMRMMKKKDILQGFRAAIDRAALGFHQFHVFVIASNLTAKKEKEIFNFLIYHKNIVKIFKGLGRWNLEFEVMLKSHFELSDFIDELRQRFPHNIRKHESMLICKSYTLENVEY